MGWLDALRGVTVAVDSAPFIYLIEKHPVYFATVSAFFAAVQNGEIRCVTSTLTIAEVLVHPFRLGRMDLVLDYQDILNETPDIEAFAVTSDIAEAAARLRANFNLRTPDAIQIATALVSQASLFLTNDKKLTKVPGLNALTIADVLASP